MTQNFSRRWTNEPSRLGASTGVTFPTVPEGVLDTKIGGTCHLPPRKYMDFLTSRCSWPTSLPPEIRGKSQLGRRGRGGSTEALRCIPVWKEVGTHALAQSRRLPEGPSSCYLSRAAASACLERPLRSQHLLGHNCLPRDSWKWDFARALTCYLILILFYGSCGFLCC